MKKYILFLLIPVFSASCTSSKKYLERGLYDQAIDKSARKLFKNPDKTKEIAVLSKAWSAANQRDMEQITYLKTTGQPDIWDEIFGIFNRLKYRQDRVRNLPPNVLSAIGYVYVDYTQETVNAQKNAAEFYYQRGMQSLKYGDRNSARQAYSDFVRVKDFFASYKDVDQKIIDAREMGTTRVLFKVQNKSGMIMPEGFEQEILKIYLSDLEGLFVRYYTAPIEGVNMHYIALLNLTTVQTSPEQVNNNSYDETKEVQNGWDYVLDRNGNVMKDSLGNDIKIPHIDKVVCHVIETRLHKQAVVSGFLDIYNVEGILLKSDPITAETVFDYVFATASGDITILKPETRDKLKYQPIPFPSDMQMIFDSAQILKEVAKSAVQRNSYLFQ